MTEMAAVGTAANAFGRRLPIYRAKRINSRTKTSGCSQWSE